MAEVKIQLKKEEKEQPKVKMEMYGKFSSKALNQDTTVEVPQEYLEYSMKPMNNRFSVMQSKYSESGIAMPGALIMNDISGADAYRFYKVFKVADNCTLIKPNDVVAIRMNQPTMIVFEFLDRVEYHFFANEVVTILNPPDSLNLNNVNLA